MELTPASAPLPEVQQPQSTPDFTPSQQLEMAMHLLSTGAITREQADRALAADGAPPLSPNQDSRTEAQIEIDTGFPPPQSPTEYRLPPIGNPSGEFTDAQMQTANAFQGWLHKARFPAEIGSTLAEDIAKATEIFSAMNETSRELWAREQTAVLERLWGPKTSENISLAYQLVSELEAVQPGIIACLENTGAGNSANVILAIFQQAERLWHRAAPAESKRK